MSAWQTVKKYFRIAYLPHKESLQYEPSADGGGTKAVAESIGAVLALYASYSELSEKLLKTFYIENSFYASAIGRLVTCLLGIAVCLHILFARKPGNPTVLAYSQIPRILAGVIIWLVLISLGLTLYDLITKTPTTLGLNVAAYELPSTQCQLVEPDASQPNEVKYLCPLSMPSGYKDQYSSLKVMVSPLDDFRLKDVSPQAKEQTVIPQKEDPLEANPFGPLRSDWVFHDFDPGKEWKLSVTLTKPNVNTKVPERPPVNITIFFYK